MKKIIFSIGIFLIVIFGMFINHKPADAVVDSSAVKSGAVISYDSDWNFSQTHNDCGPYNAAAVVRILNKENVSSTEFAKIMPWRLLNGATVPSGMEKILKDNKVVVKTPRMSVLKDDDKIIFLKKELSKGNPVLILVGGGMFNQHYLTLLGYNADVFYVYDSAYSKGKADLTLDGNGSMPGNRNLSSKELLSWWRGGGVLGFYRWYALVASKNTFLPP